MRGAGRTAAGLTCALLALAACSREKSPSIVLATTTSVEDSGLLPMLLEAFGRQHDSVRVRALVAGTGEALGLAQRGDVDVTLTHDPAAESAFVAQGHAAHRVEIMHNDFVIAGPRTDPAGIRGARDASAALAAVRREGARFVSRGDDSGTHRRERALWRSAGREAGGWGGYAEAGGGMGETLRLAEERDAYVLVDRATWRVFSGGGRLELLVEGDPRLVNRYSAMAMASSRRPELTRLFVEWLASDSAARVIGRYGRERFGEALFTPVSRAER